MNSPNKPLTAILLDDDTSQAYLLARVLEDVEDLDMELVHYTTSERAMSDLLLKKADVVFLDHFLGEGQTGMELLQQLRDSGFDGAIVMLTGSDEDGLVANFRRYGADAYLCKSDLDPVNLATVIQVALHLPHLQKPRLVLDEPMDERTAG